MKRILIAALAAVCATCAMAQGFPPGGPPGQGGPPPFGMMGPGGGTSAISNPSMLLMRPDVQGDLKLSDEQKEKVQKLMETMGPRRGGPGGGGPPSGGPPGGGPPRGGPPGGGFGGPGGMNDDFRKQMEERQKKTAAETQKILTPEQWTRLREIAIQLSGNSAVTDASVQKELGFSDVQKAAVAKLQKNLGEAGRKVMERVRNEEIEFQEAREINERNGKIMNDEIAKILTDAQKAKLKTMAGKTFTPDDQR